MAYALAANKVFIYLTMFVLNYLLICNILTTYTRTVSITCSKNDRVI